MSCHGRRADFLPMNGDPISDNHHVSRYVGASNVEDGQIDGLAFQLRKNDNFLSVNWLEFFDLKDKKAEIQKIREAFADKGRGVGTKAKFVVLNVGEMREYVQQESDDNRILSVLHDPQDNDLSHSGIYNMRHDDPLIGDLIADLVNEEQIYPAKNP